MRTIILSFIVLGTLFSACKNEKKEQKNYIDVSGYLRGQLAYFDTVPFGFVRVKLLDTIATDTQYLRKEQVAKIVEPFLTASLKKDAFEDRYIESTFADATIGKITITYTAKKTEDPVQRIVVYVTPGKEVIEKVYLTRTEASEDSSLTQQLLWKHNQSLMLITSVTKKDQTETTVTEKIAWDEEQE
ncbi:MAG: hypothetical protein ACOVP6_05370 [Lacibacter sp.]